jgi:lysophospholipase L1-like esterase
MRRLFALAVAVVGTCLLTFALATSASAAGAAYVALGDSYSAGVGAGGTTSGGDCDRSTNAYPALWAAANSPTSFTFAACSGATTADVLNSQLSSVTANTSLVSITIGGNDAGFSNIMETCVLESTDSCVAAVNTAKTFVETQLPAKLDATLQAIHTAAPGAAIKIIGYPDFYDTSASGCIGLSSADHVALNGAADDLDSTISAAAGRDNAAFVDVRGNFADHELCDSDEWLHSITWPIGNSYHPTSAGQQSGYLPAFTGAAG